MHNKTEKQKDARIYCIRKNRNKEERKSELMAKARKKNNERSEEEKKIIFWRILGERVKKWHIREKEKES